MGISISPSTFRIEPHQSMTPKVYTNDELQQLKKEPTKISVEGDVYRSSSANFKKLTLDELQHEKFAVNTSKHTYITHSDGSTDDLNQLVAIRDPMGTGEVLTFDLSKKTIDSLKEKFGDSNNFFERKDGVLRLNGAAENFVAGWMKDIRQNRNYDKADTDRNGRIEGDEAQSLTIGFERQRDYDYLGKKVVQVNAAMGANYQSLDRTPDAHHLFETDTTYHRNITTSQYTEFENTVEKELDHTLQMDANLDGTVTLAEGLSDEFGSNYRQQIIDNTQEFHEDLLEDHAELNDESRLQNYDIGLYSILSKDNEKTQQEVFHQQGLYLKEQMSQNPDFLSGMSTLNTFDANNAKIDMYG
ncbi:hypothetical protein [Sulfuricurvum sp.]|uniref:hypothetical protein n=1 Tax=Sulfuricurvum sp. TaxID=2025608 RepID=UPI0026034519|nr:hypothetical protein [Sulfuricurvum sp.]MDD4884113.1 hypothetical protein [Sulfuricurvum sp.]